MKIYLCCLEMPSKKLYSPSTVWIDTTNPLEPLKLIKLALIFMYNKAKGGWDKATAQGQRIRCSLKGSFHVKYMCRRSMQCVRVRQRLLNHREQYSMKYIRRVQLLVYNGSFFCDWNDYDQIHKKQDSKVVMIA